jgi:tripartite-type tricarboxylate transporter receptor subunit TctC
MISHFFRFSLSKIFRCYAVAGLLASAALATPQVFAQSGQTVRLVVGYAAGGPVDSAARLFAQAFSKELGTMVIVENRPGAGGVLGGNSVVKAAPDGLLLFFAASPTMTISPHILKGMSFDPSKDLKPIAPILSYSNVLVVSKDQPFKNIKELLIYAKANPGKLSYGSAGVGASNHLSGELFAKRTGTSFNHVPYKGNAPAMTDVMGGQISMMFDIIGGARTHIASGRVRALAVTSIERNASLPDVPTMREEGVADYEVGGWFGLYGPAKLSTTIVARYNDATRKALATAELRSKLLEQGYDLWLGSPETLAERASKELAMWGTVSKGIQVE